MITIISGTNRKDSRTVKIARFYEEILKSKNMETSFIDLVDLPENFLFSALDKSGKDHHLFESLQEQVANNDKFLFVTPEYNGSFPGALKTFIDGMDYPGPFKGKKCGLVGLSTGIQGAVLAMSHLTDIFNYLEMNVLALKPKLSQIDKKMDGDKLTDPWYIQLLEEQADELIHF